jgi:hypothetical protein
MGRLACRVEGGAGPRGIERNDDVDARVDELAREARKPSKIAVRLLHQEADIGAVPVSERAQAFGERGIGRLRLQPAGHQQADRLGGRLRPVRAGGGQGGQNRGGEHGADAAH